MTPLKSASPVDDTKITEDTAAKSSIRGSILLVLGRVFAILLNFCVQVLTVRYLSKADFGIYAYAISISGMLSILFALGMDKTASRFLAVYLEKRSFEKFWGMISLMFCSVGAFAITGLVVFYCLLSQDLIMMPDSENALLVLSIAAWLAVFNAVDAIFISIFAVLAKPSAIFVRRHLLAPILNLSAAIAVISLQGSVAAFAVGQLLAGIIGIGICCLMFYRLTAEHRELRVAITQPFSYPIKDVAGYSSTLLAGDVSFLLRSAFVPVAIGMFYAVEEVAQYQAVQPLARLIEFILVAFSLRFLPQAARLTEVCHDTKLQNLYEKNVVWITLLSFPLFAFVFIGCHALPSLLFGAEYASSALILCWLAIGFFTNASQGIALRLLRAQCELRTLLGCDAAIAIASILLVVPLTAAFGALGGAIAVCLVYCLQAGISLWLVAKKTRVHPFRFNCWAPFLTGIILGVAGFVGGQFLNHSIIYTMFATGLVTVLMLLFFGHSLQLQNTFPELLKLPVFCRLVPQKP